VKFVTAGSETMYDHMKLYVTYVAMIMTYFMDAIKMHFWYVRST
jgi:hypothetical protein